MRPLSVPSGNWKSLQLFIRQMPNRRGENRSGFTISRLKNVHVSRPSRSSSKGMNAAHMLECAAHNSRFARPSDTRTLFAHVSASRLLLHSSPRLPHRYKEEKAQDIRRSIKMQRRAIPINVFTTFSNTINIHLLIRQQFSRIHFACVAKCGLIYSENAIIERFEF